MSGESTDLASLNENVEPAPKLSDRGRVVLPAHAENVDIRRRRVYHSGRTCSWLNTELRLKTEERKNKTERRTLVR